MTYALVALGGHGPAARGSRDAVEAEGQASAILAVAAATAEGIRKVASAIEVAGGVQAVQLRVAEQYIAQLGHLVQGTTNLVLPANLADVGAMAALAMNVFKQQAAPKAQSGAA